MPPAPRVASALPLLALALACTGAAAARSLAAPAILPTTSTTAGPWCNKSFHLWSNATEALVKFHGKVEPGETFAYANAVYMGTDKVATLVGSCTILQAVPVGLLSFCSMDLVADADEGYFGTISLQGETRSADASVSYMSIVGGTRAYRGASGELKYSVAGARVDYSVRLDSTPCARA